ncbi:MAG: hypothetical protein VB106_15350 [Clostridiaceae bacterium]|jgi:hypothetical protein|nr:hypothetical protein [Clostridiaceae bacterium]
MVRIEFGDLTIEQISNSSGVFTGDNLQVKWRSCRKVDEGFGILEGDSNRSMYNQSAVIRPCESEE